MSIDAGTIGAEELGVGAGAGGVEWPFWCQLTDAVTQLPLVSRSVYLFSLGSLTHTQFSTVCVTSLHWDMVFYSLFPLLFYSFVARLSA